MRVVPFQYVGTCQGCNADEEVPEEKERNAVSINLDEDHSNPPYVDDGFWICLKCAGRLQKLLGAAIKECEKNVAAGKIYRHDQWQMRVRKVKPKKGPVRKRA